MSQHIRAYEDDIAYSWKMCTVIVVCKIVFKFVIYLNKESGELTFTTKSAMKPDNKCPYLQCARNIKEKDLWIPSDHKRICFHVSLTNILKENVHQSFSLTGVKLGLWRGHILIDD